MLAGTTPPALVCAEVEQHLHHYEMLVVSEFQYIIFWLRACRWCVRKETSKKSVLFHAVDQILREEIPSGDNRALVGRNASATPNTATGTLQQRHRKYQTAASHTTRLVGQLRTAPTILQLRSRATECKNIFSERDWLACGE
eukprot:m.423001 g.423001  ORF g.423001 m.423001 type:complete len:142 (+) comp56659_c0_seq16:504-929(+)